MDDFNTNELEDSLNIESNIKTLRNESQRSLDLIKTSSKDDSPACLT